MGEARTDLPPLCPLDKAASDLKWNSNAEFMAIYNQGPPLVQDLGPGYYRPWVDGVDPRFEVAHEHEYESGRTLQKRTLNVMWNGRWVPVGEVEFLAEEGRIVKIVSYTPREFGSDEGPSSES